MDLFGGIAPGPTNHDAVAFLVPFQHGPGADAELAPHLGRNGNLSLRSEFGMGDRHGLHITTVINNRASVSAGRRAIARALGGRTLTFSAREGRLLDAQTGSEWNLFGEAVAGPLKGQRLTPLPGGVHFAFAWLAFRPESEVYRAASR